MALPSFDELTLEEPQALPAFDELTIEKEPLPAFDELTVVTPEVVASEAQRATDGAKQALGVMRRIGAADWSDANETLDTQRFQQAQDTEVSAGEKYRLGQISDPELMAAHREADRIRSEMSPTTAAGRARDVRAADVATQLAKDAADVTTPSEALAGFLGSGLSQTTQPVIEGAARNLGGAAGGAAGAALGAAATVGTGGLAPLIYGIGGAVTGAFAGGKAQEALLQTTETPEETAQRHENASQDYARNPGLSKLGATAANLPFFGPSLAQFGRAAAGDAGATANIAVAGGLGAMLEAGQALIRGDTVTAKDMAEAFFLNSIMNEPTKLGRKLGLHPSSEQQAIEDLAKYEEIPPKPPAPDVFSGVQRQGAEPVVEAAPTETPSIPIESSGQPAADPIQAEAQKVGPVIYDGVTQMGEDGYYNFSDTTSKPGTRISFTVESPGAPTAEQIAESHAAALERFGVELPKPPPTSLDTYTPEQQKTLLADSEFVRLRDAGELEAAADRATDVLAPVEEPAPAAADPPPITPEAPAAEPAPLPEGTSNKEAVVNAERAARGEDPVIKEAAIENPNAIDYAERAIEVNPERPQQIIERLRTNPMERSISLEDGAILLIERTKIRSRRDAALARASNESNNATDRGIAKEEFRLAEERLNEMDQAAQDARSTWGRFGQLWQRSMREDFSLTNLERRARMSKEAPLNEKDLSKLKDISDKANAAQDAIEIRKKQVELENRQSAIEGKIEEVKAKNAPIDPAVRSLADRIIARLDTAAENSMKELKRLLHEQMKNASANPIPNPKIVLHLAKVAAARTAKKAVEFAQWSADMISEVGASIEPYLKAAWDQREQHIDTAISSGAGTKKKEVTKAVKSPKAPLDDAAQQARVEAAIAARIKEGKPLSSLAAYVNKLQESFIKQGIEGREPLIDAVHESLQKHDPKITRDDAMEIMSKYGSDYATPLSKDPVKSTRRQVDGEIQQILKLRDIAAKVPLPKSGPERPTPGPVWRSLIKKVNEAKKKLGVVVTDPETQLKSSQDAIRTRLRNDIEDMTLELETGERAPTKTPAEYTQDMEILKGVRDRIRDTLRDIESKPGLTDEQRLAMAKRSAEGSLAMWERRLAGETAKVRKGATSPEIEAIKAKRDAVKAQVEEIDAADAVLQEERQARNLVNSIVRAEEQLSNNSNNVNKAAVQGADTQLVAEAKEQLSVLREALSAQRAADPQRQMEAVERAEKNLEASIAKLDSDIRSGALDPKAKKPGIQSDRLDYLRTQRDALNKLKTQLRNEAKPRLSADELAIKSFTARALDRAAKLKERIAAGDFGPRTRKPPADITGDKKALDAQADLMAVESDFQKLQDQWKLDQMNWVQKRWRNLGQAWDATSNTFLSFDLSTPLQTAFSMAAHPIEGAKAIGKGALAFGDQFFLNSEKYAAREAAKIAGSPNAKNGLYKAMKLELPSATGKKREENMSNVLEQLAGLDAQWAGLPDVIKGLYKLEGKSLVTGGKRLAKFIPRTVGSGLKASNAAFETIANTMRARTADAILARWYKKGGPGPTKQQLELLGEQVNIMTGKGGLKTGDAIRRVFFAPNYYLSIIKQLSGYQLAKAGIYHGEGRVAKSIATDYVRAVATMGSLYGLAWLFGGTEDMQLDPKAKGFLRPKTDKGTTIDLTMGRGAYATLAAQLAPEWMGGGRTYDKRGRSHETDRMQALLEFAKGRLSRGVSSAMTSAFGKDFRNKPASGADIAMDFVIPLAWRDYDDVIKREGFTRGSFLQLLNVLGINYRVEE